MPVDFRDYFQLMQARVPESVISPKALELLDSTCGAWPADACFYFGFERELRAGPADHVDFLFCTFRAAQLAVAPERRLAAWAASRSTRPGDAWDQVARFAHEWMEETSPLREVESIWLEFDTSVPARPLEPSLFFGPELKESLRLMPAVISAALPILGLDAYGEVTAATHRWLAALPPEARPFHAGAMLARGVSGLRLCIREVPPEFFAGLLKEFGWAGDIGHFLETAQRLQPWCDHLYYNVDCLPETGPRVGLEMHLDKQMKFEPRWTGLMEELVRLGADSEGAMAVPRANGYLHEDMAGLPWPADWRETSARLEGKGLGMLLWFVNHVKITFTPGRKIVAKAYPGVELRWLDRAALRKPKS